MLSKTILAGGAVLLWLILPGISTAADRNAPLSETTAVMRAVIDHFAQQEARPDRLACVGIDDRALDDILRTPPPADPTSEVLRRIQLTGAAVEPASACAYDDDNGFRVRGEKRSGGFFLTFGRFLWSTPDRVEVPLRYCCWLGWGTAELEHSGGLWRVTQLKSWAQT